MTEAEMVGWHHRLDAHHWHAAIHGVTKNRTRLSD